IEFLQDSPTAIQDEERRAISALDGHGRERLAVETEAVCGGARSRRSLAYGHRRHLGRDLLGKARDAAEDDLSLQANLIGEHDFDIEDVERRDVDRAEGKYRQRLALADDTAVELEDDLLRKPMREVTGANGGRDLPIRVAIEQNAQL